MPSYVSKLGKWTPATEKVIINVQGVGEKTVYEGPDREAVKELETAGEKHFGVDFRYDPDFLQRIRAKGYKDMNEYLKELGFNEDEYVKDIEEKEIKQKSTIKGRKRLQNNFNGGQDLANPSNSKFGAFKEMPAV